MAKTPKCRPNQQPIKLNVKTAEGNVCVILPLEVVISLAIDRIQMGGSALEEDEAQTEELESLYRLQSPQE